MTLRFNVVYVRGTVADTTPMLRSLLAWTDGSFNLVSNGCDGQEVEELQHIVDEHPSRTELRVVSTSDVLDHGTALNRLLEDEGGPYFAIIDSDIFAHRPVQLERLLPEPEQVATCSGIPVWQSWSDCVLADTMDWVSGRFVETARGLFLGCTYVAVYRTEDLRRVFDEWDVSFVSARFDRLPEPVQEEFAKLEFVRRTYDTGKVAHVLLQRGGRRMVYVDTPGLVHVGAMSHGLHRPTSASRLKSWLWRKWQVRGHSDQDRRTRQSLRRRRLEAHQLVSALRTSGPSHVDRPEWIGQEEFEGLATVLGPKT